MKISIIGSGSGGFAMAAYLNSIGHEVCVFSKSMQEDDSFHLKASGIINNKFTIIRSLTSFREYPILNI